MTREKPASIEDLDWRMQYVATLVNDLPAAFPGGLSHKAGTTACLSILSKHSDYGLFGFPAPSIPALALNTSLRAAREACRLRGMFHLMDGVTPHGPGKDIPQKDASVLFDFFEHAMTSVAFGFMAIEAYANQTVAALVKGVVPVKRKKQTIDMDANEIERNLSTEEKIATILPHLLGVPSAKRLKIWQEFKVLKSTRDSIVHLKSFDMHYTSDIDRKSLFFRLINENPLQYPATALCVISHFMPKGRPRWAMMFADEIGIGMT